jgi:hypothetical protein
VNVFLGRALGNPVGKANRHGDSASGTGQPFHSGVSLTKIGSDYPSCMEILVKTCSFLGPMRLRPRFYLYEELLQI